MDSAGLQCRYQAALAEDGLLDGLVIHEHGHDRFAVANRIGRRVCHPCCLRRQRFGLATCPVIHSYVVSDAK